jgi:excisionase family DNA binding protein
VKSTKALADLKTTTIAGSREPLLGKSGGDVFMAEDKTMDELLTVREVARRLRVDDTTVRRWIKSGALEAITLPHRGKRQAYRVKKSTMDKLMQNPHLMAE